jgi:hypothetical protein
MPSSKQIEIGRKKELDQDGYSQLVLLVFEPIHFV